MYRKMLFLVIVVFNFNTIGNAQKFLLDSATITKNDTSIKKLDEQRYQVVDGKTFFYPKPKLFGFITKLPKDAAGIAVAPFKKKNLKPLLYVAGSTAALLFADQTITDGVRKFSDNINLQPQESYTNIWSVGLGKTDVSLLKAPKNLNTGIYQFGQGFPSLLIGAGLYTYGKIHHNYRAISTASQLAEAFILMGVGTQVIKRVTGRQSPSEATSNGGTWHFFPSFKNYQNHTPYYDAFPSGHLATIMSTVTILAENYPEKKWIKPIGYSVTGLLGYAMINNEVHWASDYPLAIALGYLCAKQVVKNNRREEKSFASSKKKATLSYTFNYVSGKFLPGVVCKF